MLSPLKAPRAKTVLCFASSSSAYLKHLTARMKEGRIRQFEGPLIDTVEPPD